MTTPRRGEIWWGEIEDVGRRPFLVLTRDAAIPVLNSLVCAPVTTTIRSIPSELALDESDGMPKQCVASMDNIRVIPKSRLVSRLAALPTHRMDELCLALRTAVEC